MELLAHVVDTLAFEENHRIGALQSRIHQTFGVVRSNREHHFQARDMGCQRRPVLRVLRAVFRPYRYADDYRHLQDVAAHGLPFG